MASKNDILAVRKSRSQEITAQVRYIAYGMIVLVYTTLTSTSEFSASLVREYETHLVLILIFSAWAIICDYLQFLCGYRAAVNVNIDDVSASGDYKFDTDSFSYYCIAKFYNCKQILVIIAVSILMYTMASALL